MVAAKTRLELEVTDELRRRFMQKVDQSEGCWDWCGASRGNGYGAIKVNGKVVDAHRVSYVIHKGPVPVGKLVMHSCDNRTCVNPEHLSLGDCKDNHNDAIAKGLVKPFRPKRSEPLTVEQVDEIRLQYERGVGIIELSRKFNIARTSLRRVLGL